MFEWFRRLFAMAKVDGITFYSKSAFDEYMIDKEREEKGLHRYTHRVVGNIDLGRAINILEKRGVFDYSYEQDYYYLADVFDVHYWSDRLILVHDSVRQPKPTNGNQPKE